jgi:hypothetical protein
MHDERDDRGRYVQHRISRPIGVVDLRDQRPARQAVLLSNGRRQGLSDSRMQFSARMCLHAERSIRSKASMTREIGPGPAAQWRE